MFGCVDLNCGSDPATQTIANDNALGDPTPYHPTNSDNAFASNDNELVENAAVSTSLSVATRQNTSKCLFKQCLSGTFNACEPLAITDEKPATPYSSVAKDDPDHHGNTERSTLILQQLGVLHLEDKLTRPRLSQETDEHILREAGAARYHFDRKNGDDDVEDNDSNREEREMVDKIKLKSLTAREAQILREAGVTWTDHTPIDACYTATTVGATDSYVTAEHSSLHYKSCHVGVNNTYAEKELLRRLKNGWVSTGMVCHECGMPVICQKEGGEELMECIICGVVELNEEGETHDTPLGEDVRLDDESLSCFDTTITSGFTVTNHGQNMTTSVSFCRSYPDSTVNIDQEAPCPSYEKSMISKCKSDLTAQDDNALKKELGRRIFSGWKLLSLSCPSCNLPLISDGNDGPSVCLRCG